MTNDELLKWAEEGFATFKGDFSLRVEVAKVLAQCLATRALEQSQKK